MLSEEQAEQIKSQIILQIEQAGLENKEQIKAHVLNMDSEQLEQFLMQNKLIKGSSGENSQEQCIFCGIINENISSYKISENPDAIAVLEINPISKGHMLIIPKTHENKMPKEAFDLSEKISKIIKSNLKPKNILSYQSELFGHSIINLLPVYKNENPNSQRKKSSPEELKELQDALEIKSKIKKPKLETLKIPKIKKISSEKLWLPRRIP